MVAGTPLQREVRALRSSIWLSDRPSGRIIDDLDGSSATTNVPKNPQKIFYSGENISNRNRAKNECTTPPERRERNDALLLLDNQVSPYRSASLGYWSFLPRDSGPEGNSEVLGSVDAFVAELSRLLQSQILSLQTTTKKVKRIDQNADYANRD